MVISNDGPAPASSHEVGLEDHVLQAFAMGLGMDPQSQDPMLRPDVNYLQGVAKLPIDFSKVPSGTDVPGMRRWIEEVYLEPNLTELRNKCNAKRRRAVQKVEKKVVSVTPSDNSDETFEIWIYQTEGKHQDQGPQDPRPAILMFHGGGWIHGNPVGDEVVAEFFVSELDVVAIGVDYRLAPEHHCPTPVNDCMDVLAWVSQNADTYNIDISRIGLWGASAGGNLAAALALKHSQEPREESKDLKISLASLVVPVTAHPKALARFEEQRSFPKSKNEALFEGGKPPPEVAVQEMEKLYKLYIGEEGDPNNSIASPLLAKPTAAHPAAHITVAACDLLRDQALAYGALLRSCGVSVGEEVLPGVPHAFTWCMSATVVERWLERERNRFAEAFGL